MKLKELHENKLDGVWVDTNVHSKSRSELELVRFEDKDKFLKSCLNELKHSNYPNPPGMVKMWIWRARKAGFDYPEFKTIEKSIGKLGEAELHENRYAISDGILHHEPNGTMLVKFKDKKAFLKMCLRELKDGEEWITQHWIKMCRKAGYDYPEFKAIEKSLTEAKGGYSISTSDGMVTFGDKEKFIKYLLKCMKVGNDSSSIAWYIKMARADGYDYPEFKTIEKSLGAVKEEIDFSKRPPL